MFNAILHRTINKLIWGRPLFYVSAYNMCMSLTSTLVGFVLKRIKAPFCMYVFKEKLSHGERIACELKLRWANLLFIHFLTKHGELFMSETKSWRRRRVIPLALLERPTFLLKNTLAHPAMSAQSRWENPRKCECCFRQSEHMQALLPRAPLARASFVHINGGELVKLNFLQVISFYM